MQAVKSIVSYKITDKNQTEKKEYKSIEKALDDIRRDVKKNKILSFFEEGNKLYIGTWSKTYHLISCKKNQ